MEIRDLALLAPAHLESAAAMLVREFAAPTGWPTIERAREEVARILADGFALGMTDGADLAGWIGGLPEYDGRVWELHPLVVRGDRRLQGIGRSLVSAFERAARERGGITATLGTDDDHGMTSLAGVDLYQNLPDRLASLRDLGRRHPFLFYRRLGYVVTGVMPDANGPGRPDIFLSKRLVP